jgi:hypothetical protein
VVDADLEISNAQYLQQVLTTVRWRLERMLDPTAVEDTVYEQASALRAQYEAMALPLPAIKLARCFGLTPFELEILLLCVGVELDPGIAKLCADVQGSPHRAYPTFALSLALFDEPEWGALSPERPLRYWRLIEVRQSGFQPLTASPLRADERIVNYIKGLNHLDERLSHLVTPLNVPESQQSLAPSQRTMVEQTVQHLREGGAAHVPIIRMLGNDPASKRVIAWYIASALSLVVYHMPVSLIPANPVEVDNLARLWRRESMLMPIALYIDASNLADPVDGSSSALERFIARSDGRFLLDAPDIIRDLGRPTLDVLVARPSPEEQQKAWSDLLGDRPALVDQLTGQLNLSFPAIQEIVGSVLAPPSAPDYEAQVWQRCLFATRPHLDVLAQRLEPKATWDDLVLPRTVTYLLHQIADQIRYRRKVYGEWGIADRVSRGLGLIVLFSGESGTGKTMSAEVIANDLQLNLYRIDLSAIVSKYIGETEKNLKRLFDAAEDGGSILFFDEADSLFGKRSQVKDSHDRYANIETNYLLQRIEAFNGLAILATNMKSSLDEAFTRRIRFAFDFPVPDQNSRKHIWRKMFSGKIPTEDLDFNRLSSFNLVGGSIFNIVVNASFLAAASQSPVTMEHVLNAVRTELLKADRLIDESAFVVN